MQTTSCFDGSFDIFRSLEQMFYLEFLASDCGSFIPVYFSQMVRTIMQPNTRDSLALAPTDFLQPGAFANAGPRGECLDIRNLAQNLEFHSGIVSEPGDTVNDSEIPSDTGAGSLRVMNSSHPIHAGRRSRHGRRPDRG